MDFQGVKDIDIYGTHCVADISQGDDDRVTFISAKEKHFDVKVENGTLSVTQRSRNILMRLIAGRIEFKLILPRDFKGKLRYRNKNGGLYINNIDFSDLDLYTKNGKFDITAATCNSFALKMKNGSVSIKNLNARDAVSVKCANGDIKIEAVNSPALSVSCQNAGLSAIDVRSKKVDCSTSNGTIDASAVAADELRLETSNGKINAMLIGNRNDYKLSAETTHGSITIDGVHCKNISDVSHAAKQLKAKTSNGDIDLRFM